MIVDQTNAGGHQKSTSTQPEHPRDSGDAHEDDEESSLPVGSSAKRTVGRVARPQNP